MEKVFPDRIKPTKKQFFSPLGKPPTPPVSVEPVIPVVPIITAPVADLRLVCSLNFHLSDHLI